jgi:hypothetical protein
MQILKLILLQLFYGHSNKLQLYRTAQNRELVDHVWSGCIYVLGSLSAFQCLQHTV